MSKGVDNQPDFSGTYLEEPEQAAKTLVDQNWWIAQGAANGNLAMAKCLRCNAWNEWIEGNVRAEPKEGVMLRLTENQAAFLRMLLTTHTHVVELGTGRRCAAILKKLPL